MLTDDIYGRIEKSIFKISGSKNKSSISGKIAAFNEGVREYNELMDKLLNTIKTESDSITATQERNAAKVEELLDKYDEIFNNTKKAIVNNTLSKLPTIDKIVKDSVDGIDIDSITTNAEEYGKYIKVKLDDYTNPDDSENSSYIPFRVYPITVNDAFNDRIQNTYPINKIIKVRKDANLKAIEFGFSITQYNLNHFDKSEFDNDDYIGKPDNENIIHRYYRGILFFSDIFDSEKFKVRAKLQLPDTNPFDSESSIGPDIEMKYGVDNEYIYIVLTTITPFRIDWNISETTGNADYFDIYNKYYVKNSRVFLVLDGYFDDLTSRETKSLGVDLSAYDYENHDTLQYKIEDVLEKKFGESGGVKYLCTISPEKTINKFIGFDYKSENRTVTKPTKKSYYSHELVTTIDNNDFDNYYESDIEDIVDFIKEVSIDEFDEKSLDIYKFVILKNYIFVLTNYGLYAKDIETNEIFKPVDDFDFIDEGNEYKILDIGLNKNGQIQLFTTVGFIDFQDNIRTFQITNSLDSKDVKSILNSVIESRYIKNYGGYCLYNEKGIVLLKEFEGNMFNFTYVYIFKSEDDISDIGMSSRFFKFGTTIAFACNNKIIHFDYRNEEDVSEINISDKISASSQIIKSIFYNYNTEKIEVLYFDKTSDQFKIILDLDTKNSLTVRILKSSFFDKYKTKDIYVINHPWTKSLFMIVVGEDGSVIGKFAAEDMYKDDFVLSGKEFSDIEFTADFDFFSIDENTGDFVFYTNEKLIICRADDYEMSNTLSTLRQTILEDLKKIADERENLVGRRVGVPYKLTAFGTKKNSLSYQKSLDKVYTEFGSFIDFQTENFEFHNTNSTLFAVNKNDNTTVYISSSDLNRFEDLVNNEKLYEMNLVKFPMGFKSLVDYNLDSECEYFLGDDGEIYQFGAYYPEVDSKNYLAKPRKIEFDHDEPFKYVIVIKDRVYGIDNIGIIHIKDAKNEKNKQIIREFEDNYIDLGFYVSTKGIIFFDKIDISENDGSEPFECLFLDYEMNTLTSKEIPNAKYGVGTLDGFVFVKSDNVVVSLNLETFELNDDNLGASDTTEIYPFVFKDPDVYDPSNIVFNHGYPAFISRNSSDYYMSYKNNDVWSQKRIINSEDGTFEVIENNIYSVIFINEDGDLFNYGVSNGYHSSFRYGDEEYPHEIPKFTTFLGNETIEKVFIDTNKSYIVTGSGKLFACGSKINRVNTTDSNPYLGFEFDDEEKDYFEEIKDLEFNPLTIKKMIFDIWCTFILLEDGSLYAFGNDKFGNMGIDSKPKSENVFDKPKLIAKDVENIWGDYNREIIEKIIDGESVFYGAGDNEYGKLGAKNNSEYRVWTEIEIYPSYANEKIKEIYFFKDNTFALTESGSVYVSGRNDSGQLGVDSYSHVYEFRLCTSASNVEKIYSNKDSSMIAIIDYSGNLKIAGNKYGNLIREFVQEPFEDYFCTGLTINSNNCLIATYEDRTEDKGYIMWINSSGVIKTNEFQLKRVRKIASVDSFSNVFYMIHSGIGLLSKVTVDVNEDDEIVFDIDTLYGSVEPNSVTAGFNYYKHILTIPNSYIVKTINVKNEIGAFTTSGSDFEDYSYGIGFGKVTGTDNINNYGKMYLGVSNFDNDKEVNSIGQYYDYKNEADRKTEFVGTLLNKLSERFNDHICSIDLEVYPFVPSKNKLDVTIPGETEERTTVNLIGKIS